MVCGRECEDPQGAAGALLDLEWCCDDDGTFRWQKVKIGEALQAVAAVAVDIEVRRVGRIEMLRLPRIGAYRLGTKAMQVAFLDRHPKTAVCFHPVRVIWEDGGAGDPPLQTAVQSSTLSAGSARLSASPGC